MYSSLTFVYVLIPFSSTIFFFLQILQMTLLIADYMNMIGRTAPGTLASLPSTPKARTMTPSRSSSRARGTLTTAPNTPRPDHRDGGHRDATPRLSRKWSHLAAEPNATTN